jgi:hypothetical protein
MMKTAFKNNIEGMGLFLANSQYLYKDVIWTDTPNTIKNLRFTRRGNDYIILLTMKGLTGDNFKVSIVGNILMIVLEKKKEFVMAAAWNDSHHIDEMVSNVYSIFERSDIFLSGDTEKKVKSVRCAENELEIVVENLKKEV